jgi:hypothetical protein
VRDLDGVSVRNVSIYGDLSTLYPPRGRVVPRAKGIALMGDVRGFEARNNVFAGLGDVAIEVTSPISREQATVSFDHDLFDLGRSPLARWNGARYPSLDGAGGLRVIGQERNGREGRAVFRTVPGSAAAPPDLHPAPSSAAAGMKAGAYVAGAGTP